MDRRLGNWRQKIFVLPVFFLMIHPSFAAPGGAEHSACDGMQDRWFAFAGLMNYHTRLEESEGQIDREINGTLGKLIAGWERPRTFKDWSNDWMLWDSFAGFGRDICPNWDWCVDFGGGAGTIKNHDTYGPLGLRLKTRVDFTRTECFVEGSLDYYPWGKPRGIETRSGNVFEYMGRALRETKPYFSVVSGYSRQTALAEVRVRLPIFGNLLNMQQKDSYDLFYACPRVAVEIPLRNNDFLDVTAGYVFFDKRAREFDSECFGVYW